MVLEDRKTLFKTKAFLYASGAYLVLAAPKELMELNNRTKPNPMRTNFRLYLPLILVSFAYQWDKKKRVDLAMRNFGHLNRD